MDPVRNPYSPGAGSPPPALVGRSGELRSFDIAVQRFGLGRPARSLLMTGLRGVGKTVLLREFGWIARRYGWVHQQIEVTEDLGFPEAMATLVRTAVLRLSAGQRIVARTRRAPGVLRSFQVKWSLPGDGDVTVGLDPLPGWADSGMLEVDLADLFIEVGGMARDRGVGVLFTIDEMHDLSRPHLTALVVALHRISQEGLPFAVVGAGLPSLPGLVGEARSYAERLFEFSVINSLAAPDAEAALVEPAEAEGVRWHPEALERIVNTTEGYPYFLQEFGKQAWDVAEGPDEIGPSDVGVALPIAVNELDVGFFRIRLGRTTDAERSYLAAMASLGPGPHTAGEVAAALGRTATEVAPHRAGLISGGLCYSPRRGAVAFAVPMFDRFVRRRMA